MNHGVFVSYSTKDIETVEDICQYLEDHNIRCWYAKRDIPAGHNYAQEIMRALKQAQIVVLVFSSSADASRDVQREIERSVKYKKHIVPYCIEDIDFGEHIEYFISERQRIHAFASEIALEELQEAIKRQMGTNTITKGPKSHNDTEWPKVGINFLKKFRQRVLNKLSFEYDISNEEEMEDEHTLECYVTEEWYYCIGFENKRHPHVDIYWGLYSDKERDPKFRKLCQKIEDHPDFLEDDDDIFFGEWDFEFDDEDGYLGFETDECIKISKLHQKEFFEEVLESFLELCEETWLLVEKYT